MPGKKDESIPESDYRKEESDILLPDNPPCIVTFHGKDGKEVGKLEFTDGIMKFTGKMKPSAKVFFDWLNEGMVNPYVERKIKKIRVAMEKAFEL